MKRVLCLAVALALSGCGGANEAKPVPKVELAPQVARDGVAVKDWARTSDGALEGDITATLKPIPSMTLRCDLYDQGGAKLADVPVNYPDLERGETARCKIAFAKLDQVARVVLQY